jgi:hypothetical protein
VLWLPSPPGPVIGTAKYPGHVGHAFTTLALVTQWLLRALAYAELIFVACFLGTETVRLLLRRRVVLMERFTHTIPQDRYLTWVMQPLATAVTGVGISIGVNLALMIHSDGWMTRDGG